jgi:hypothetical protein
MSITTETIIAEILGLLLGSAAAAFVIAEIANIIGFIIKWVSTGKGKNLVFLRLQQVCLRFSLLFS